MSLARIAAAYGQKLHEVVRGSPIDEQTEAWLKTQLDLDEIRAVRDLNTAARVVTGQLDPSRAAYQVIRMSPDLETGLCLPFEDGAFDRIVLSLVLSYVHEPRRTLAELFRTLAPGGLLVLSSMVPDADFSGAFRAIIAKIESAPESALPFGWSKDLALESARQLLNDASALSDLETEGVFEFFSGEQLRDLLERAGFVDVTLAHGFGDPPQAVIARGRRPVGTAGIDVHGTPGGRAL
jgi:SAM-dependent methyltransferase